MSKKSTVTSILQANITAVFAAVFFRVGDVPRKNDGEEAGLPTVLNIKFCKHYYGQGAQVNEACYAVEFENGAEKLIIPATQYTQVTLAVIDKSDEDTIPPMPAE